MDELFAPWRIEWVERDPEEKEIEGCPFCVLPDRDADRESRIVARSEHSFVILNNAPYAPGHVMVIPDRHTGEWADLSDGELLDHAKLKVAAIDALEEGFDPDGVNAGENLGGDAAGGSIDDHLHTHLIPRWSGDTNFMPLVSDTKVIVEALEDSYDKLQGAFATLPDGEKTEKSAAVRLRFD
ncbi:HIT family protein [Halolamina salifodinae]|uniref:ATP adenylyltransferase n=1 Tax=Halolamina salifodinae TaxID=1202767 RepID=A0A8T4GZ06_9EURY|nr:HIT domain-containing protein [Halolamina salifodinae]MBP1988239.1 ATP adenylyltransferase [Halolamina salifodinae]